MGRTGGDFQRYIMLFRSWLRYPFMRLPRPKWLKARGGRYVVHQADLVNLIGFNLDMVSFLINLSTSRSC
jgi:hypothetical protein